MFSCLAFLLLAFLARPPEKMMVNGLSCLESALNRSRMVAIKDSYCNSEDVYSGQVIAATCNCLQSEGSQLSHCHYYQLDFPNSIINTTLLTSSTCEGDYYGLQACSSVGNSLITWGLRVVDPNQSSVNISNITMTGRNCRYPCSFNAAGDLQLQPCLYTVRVGEVFKGSYTMGEEIEVVGPDVIFQDLNRVLEVYTSYLAGIGGACNPIGGWSQLSTYSSDELDQLRTGISCGSSSEEMVSTSSSEEISSEEMVSTNSSEEEFSTDRGLIPSFPLLSLSCLVLLLLRIQ